MQILRPSELLRRRESFDASHHLRGVHHKATDLLRWALRRPPPPDPVYSAIGSMGEDGPVEGMVVDGPIERHDGEITGFIGGARADGRPTISSSLGPTLTDTRTPIHPVDMAEGIVADE